MGDPIEVTLTVALDEETYAAYRESGLPLADLVKRGLKHTSLHGGGEMAGPDPLRQEVRDLLAMLRQGYALTRSGLMPGERMAYPAVPDAHEAHTVDGPANCRRCQLLRDNAHWMDAEVNRLASVRREECGDEVADNPPQDPVSYADPDFRPPDNPGRRRGGVED